MGFLLQLHSQMGPLQLCLAEEALLRPTRPVLQHQSIQRGAQLPQQPSESASLLEAAGFQSKKIMLWFSVRWSTGTPQRQGEWLVCPLNSAGRELTVREMKESYSWQNLCCTELFLAARLLKKFFKFFFNGNRTLSCFLIVQRVSVVVRGTMKISYNSGCARQSLYPAVFPARFSLSPADTS